MTLIRPNPSCNFSPLVWNGHRVIAFGIAFGRIQGSTNCSTYNLNHSRLSHKKHCTTYIEDIKDSAIRDHNLLLKIDLQWASMMTWTQSLEKCKIIIVFLSTICASYGSILSVLGLLASDDTSKRVMAIAGVILTGFGTIFTAIASFNFNISWQFINIADCYEESSLLSSRQRSESLRYPLRGGGAINISLYTLSIPILVSSFLCHRMLQMEYNYQSFLLCNLYKDDLSTSLIKWSDIIFAQLRFYSQSA